MEEDEEEEEEAEEEKGGGEEKAWISRVSATPPTRKEERDNMSANMTDAEVFELVSLSRTDWPNSAYYSSSNHSPVPRLWHTTKDKALVNIGGADGRKRGTSAAGDAAAAKTGLMSIEMPPTAAEESAVEEEEVVAAAAAEAEAEPKAIHVGRCSCCACGCSWDHDGCDKMMVCGLELALTALALVIIGILVYCIWSTATNVMG